MLHIVWSIIVGFVIGLLARALVPGTQKMGFVATVILGILGSLVGGFIGRAIGIYRQGQGAGLIMSVIGAILLLVIYHAIVGRRTA